jgi:hypothetical protein
MAAVAASPDRRRCVLEEVLDPLAHRRADTDDLNVPFTLRGEMVGKPPIYSARDP